MARVILKPSSPRQEEFLKSNAFITIYGGSAGSGKAQPLDAKILTPDGWKFMGDITLGSQVITPDNNVANVIGVFPFDSKPIYKITTKSGRVTEACDEHLWQATISVPKKKSQSGIVTTQTMIDILQNGDKVYIPVSAALSTNQNPELPFDPYMLGVLIGDGNMTSHNVKLSSTDQEIIDYFNEALISYGCHLNHLKNYDFGIVQIDKSVKRDELGRIKNSNHVVDVLKKLGLMGENSFTKFIPDVYLNASIEDRFELLRGLLDSDGTISKCGTIEFSTVSKQLANDVKQLTLTLGGVAKIVERTTTYTYNGEKKQGSLSYRVYLKFKDSRKVFKLTRKSSLGRVRENLLDEIVSIEYVGEKPAQCIAIDSDDHLYITDDYIVTHNTYQGLMRFLRYTNDPEFVGYVIRKNATDLKKTGGAFRTALQMFKPFGITHTKQPMVITFPSGATIEFIGLDGEEGMNKIQGLEISACMIDEATHISDEEFWWTVSRLRTNANMMPNIWLTCNPDPDSFVFNLIESYIYQKGTYVNNELVEGRVDPDKNGKVLYYMRLSDVDGNDHIVFRETKEEFYEEFPEITDPESDYQPETLKFIGATCHDNPEMLKKNPKYVSNLRSLPRIKRERLYYGNWLVREEEGGYFKKEWVEPLLTTTKGLEFTRYVRCWDLASALKSEANPDPDYTAGVLIGKTRCGKYVILDVVRDRKRSGSNIDWIAEIARDDMKRYGEKNYQFYLPQDPASAGITARQYHVEKFNEKGLGAKFIKVGTTKSKLKRFEPFSASSEIGLVYVIKSDWNNMYFDELEAFDGISKSRHDD